MDGGGGLFILDAALDGWLLGCRWMGNRLDMVPCFGRVSYCSLLLCVALCDLVLVVSLSRVFRAGVRLFVRGSR